MKKNYLKIFLLLLTFLFAITLFFANQITVSSQITNVTITIKANVKAQVYISNIYRGDTPLTINLGTGKYPLKLVANGYKTFETVITVSPTGPKEFSFNLEPIASTGTTTTTTTSTTGGKARLIVKADIPCYVYSNNVRIGMTPLDVEMYPGTYEIRVEPTDKSYAPKVEKINLQKGQVLELNFTFLALKPQSYSITINANVQAQVLINNQPVGNTPLTTNLIAGTYTITLNPLQAGYSSLTQTIVVSQQNQIFNFTLNPVSYSITINANVQAQVLINNQPVGNTPLKTNL
ncbi:MAG: PEGA domain-containing protein, partial [Exilispira sp.]